jgi:hypothetical protein
MDIFVGHNRIARSPVFLGFLPQAMWQTITIDKLSRRLVLAVWQHSMQSVTSDPLASTNH